MTAVMDQPARPGEATEGVLFFDLDARVHPALPDVSPTSLLARQFPLVGYFLLAHLPVVAVLPGRAGTLPRRDVQRAVAIETEVGVVKRVEGQVVLQVLDIQEILGPVVAFERFIAAGMVNRGPSFQGQTPVRPHSPQGPAVDVGQDQVAVGRHRHLLRKMPPGAVQGERTAERLEQFRDDQLRPAFACHLAAEVLHARARQAWIERHDGPQVLALPVEDPQFRRLPDPPRIGQHVQLPLLLVHGEIPDDAPRMRIAREQEPLQFQSHLARRARMSRTGAKLDRLPSFFGQKRSPARSWAGRTRSRPIGRPRRTGRVWVSHSRAPGASPVPGCPSGFPSRRDWRTCSASRGSPGPGDAAAASDVESDLGGERLVLARRCRTAERTQPSTPPSPWPRPT